MRFAPQRRALFRHRNLQKCPNMVCFVHFHVQICFVPQRRALFRHFNSQKWSDGGMFCTLSLPHVLCQEGFGSFRFVSVRGNRKQGRFGSWNGRFVSVRATLRFGSVRFVEAASRAGSVHVMAGSCRFARHCGSVCFGLAVCGVAGREVFDRICLDDSGIGIRLLKLWNFFFAERQPSWSKQWPKSQFVDDYRFLCCFLDWG